MANFNGIASARHEHVKPAPVLIDHASEVMQLTPDTDKDPHPCATYYRRDGMVPLALVSKQPAETQALSADALIS